MWYTIQARYKAQYALDVAQDQITKLKAKLYDAMSKPDKE